MTCVGTHGVKSTKTVTQEENSVWAQDKTRIIAESQIDAHALLVFKAEDF